MSSRYDDDAFQISFDDAVNQLHRREFRGNAPSARAWQQVRTDISQQQEHTLVSHTAIASTAEAEHDLRVDRAGAPVRRADRKSGSYLNWTTWLAVAAVIVLLASNLRSLWPAPESPQITPEQNVAMAPQSLGTAETVESQIATPTGSPMPPQPEYTYGPEFACNVEPLTEQQVFDIVMNPYNEHIRRGADPAGKWRDMEESGGDTIYWRSLMESKSSFTGTDDETVTSPVANVADTFWNCIMTGTALQVWSLMDPGTVQHEILKQYPVLREESTIRRHISQWGSKRYSASLYHAFPDLGNTEPIQASRHADRTYGSVAISQNQDYVYAAIVVMVPHEDSGNSPLNYYELLLKPTPDGDWWVVAINFPANYRGRG